MKLQLLHVVQSLFNVAKGLDVTSSRSG